MQTCTQNPPRPFWRAAGEASAAHSLSLRWCLGRSRAWGAGTEFREPAPGEKRCSAGRVVRRLGPCSLPSRGSGRAFPGGAGAHTMYLVSVGGVGDEKRRKHCAPSPDLTGEPHLQHPDKPPEGSRAWLPGLTGSGMGSSHLTDRRPSYLAANGATQPSPRSGGGASSACSHPLSPGPWGSALLAQEAPVCWAAGLPHGTGPWGSLTFSGPSLGQKAAVCLAPLGQGWAGKQPSPAPTSEAHSSCSKAARGSRGTRNLPEHPRGEEPHLWPRVGNAKGHT